MALTTDNENEALNALRALRRRGFTADTLIAALTTRSAPVIAERDDWEEQLAFVFARQEWLNDRELRYVMDIANADPATWRWTPRRRKYLRDIYMRVQIVSSLNPV